MYAAVDLRKRYPKSTEKSGNKQMVINWNSVYLESESDEILCLCVSRRSTCNCLREREKLWTCASKFCWLAVVMGSITRL
ncbi:hypothetical protein HanPI659440_Chr10g0399551 [Helianthus annuus]|nr:hypothetical protein HanPI659440_Chr10g0399551 [Helianthus annuus]